jgi:hypothetical protein
MITIRWYEIMLDSSVVRTTDLEVEFKGGKRGCKRHHEPHRGFPLSWLYEEAMPSNKALEQSDNNLAKHRV